MCVPVRSPLPHAHIMIVTCVTHTLRITAFPPVLRQHEYIQSTFPFESALPNRQRPYDLSIKLPIKRT